MNSNLYIVPLVKINSKWIIDLNVLHTIKFRKEKQQKTFVTLSEGTIS